MEAVVLGSSGLVGIELVQQLIRNQSYTKILILTRKPNLFNSQKVIDLTFNDLSEILNFQFNVSNPVFFCCFGTTLKSAGNKNNFFDIEFKAILDFAKLAVRYNASKFLLVSSKGSDEKSIFFYNRVKGTIETNVSNLGLKSLVIFRPGLLIGQRKENRPIEKLSIGLVNRLNKLFGVDFSNSFSTAIPVLVSKMIEESSNFQQNVIKIVESRDL